MCYWTEKWRVLWVCFALVTMVMGVTPEAQAFGPEEQRLYEDAKDNLKKGAYTDALLGFKKVLPMVVGDKQGMWQILVAVSLTYEKMGEPVHAAEYYSRFLARIEPEVRTLDSKWRQRYLLARETLEELEAFLLSSQVHVRVESVPSGAAVIIDGVRSGADMNANTPFETYLTPGNHTIAVRKEGVGSAHEMLASVLGKSMIIHLRMGESPIIREWAKSKMREDLTIARPAPVSDQLGWDVAGWTSIGIGLAVLGTGLFFTLDAAENHQSLSDLSPALGPIDGPATRSQLIAGLEDSELRAGVLYGTGGLAVATGILLLFAEDLGWTSDTKDEMDLTSMGLSPVEGGLLAFTHWSF